MKKIRARKNGKPTGVKPSGREHHERVALAAKMLCQGKHKHEIKRTLINTYRVCARTCENYLARARAELLAAAGVGREELIAKSYGFYTSVLQSATATTSEKLQAQKGIDRLFGLELRRHELSGPDGNPLASNEVRLYLPWNGRDKDKQFDWDALKRASEEIYALHHDEEAPVLLPMEPQTAQPPPQLQPAQPPPPAEPMPEAQLTLEPPPQPLPAGIIMPISVARRGRRNDDAWG